MRIMQQQRRTEASYLDPIAVFTALKQHFCHAIDRRKLLIPCLPPERSLPIVAIAKERKGCTSASVRRVRNDRLFFVNRGRKLWKELRLIRRRRISRVQAEVTADAGEAGGDGP
ncbi:hypothetical protein SDJN02_19200, partial [Cucurbita argyrosperma subsp. argyrosperma]